MYTDEYCFRPIYYFSRIFGVMPFSIVCDLNGEIKKIKISVFDGLWFFISISIYLLMAIIYQRDLKLVIDQRSFLYAAGNFLLILSLAIYVIAIGTDMYNRSKYVEILKKITVFDNEVSHFNFF